MNREIDLSNHMDTMSIEFIVKDSVFVSNILDLENI